MDDSIFMTSTRPYLLRAYYDWIIDNRLTPYIVVDSNIEHVQVPIQYVDDDGKIILNISPVAVQVLSLENDYVEFNARFGGHAMHIYIPIQAVSAIYAKENGRGLVFGIDEDGDDGGDRPTPPPENYPDDDKPKVKRGKPNLKIVK